MVQGVVVQITTLAPSRARTPVAVTGKRTQMVGETWSWYSTSASASAVFSTTDQSTGRAPA